MRSSARVAGVLATAGLLLSGAAVLAPVTPVAAAEPTVTITGHGFGHGRGMGQWGALGYAVDRGWSARQILDHYYGGTVAGTVPDLPISVELVSQRGRGAIVTAPGLTVNGRLTGSGAVLVERVGAGTFSVKTGPGCAGPWTPAGQEGTGLVIASVDAPTVEVCEAGQIRGYRGDVQVVERAGTTQALVNRVRVETYLRGVVPRESPASWADLGGGRGAQAIRAQTVAARSYSLATPYAPYATTCDTIQCQVYGGAWTRPFSSATRTPQDDPRTDAAIAATTGEVRKNGSGTTMRTEFSASTGGFTAGGVYPAVEDLGDAYAANPNRNWSASFTFADLSSRLGVGELTGLRVTSRNGLGVDGGRVLQVVADTTTGPKTLTGDQVRSRLGIKSDWFVLSTTSYAEAQALVRGIWADLLGRAPSSAELAGRSRELAAGRPTADLARDVAASGERAGHLVDEAYAAALGRAPAAGERAGWSQQFLSSGSLVELRAGIFGSRESLLVAGGTLEGWTDRLYRGVLARGATAEERAYWAARARTDGQAPVVRAVAGSEEALVRRLDAYYARMLQRPRDSGSGGFVTELRSRGEITVPVGIAASPEYRAKVQGRFPA